MANQFELFDTKPKKKPKSPKQESTKRKASWLGENKKEFIRETRVEHICARDRCGQLILKGSSAIKLTPFEKGKPVFDKIAYFHRENECPALRPGE